MVLCTAERRAHLVRTDDRLAALEGRHPAVDSEHDVGGLDENEDCEEWRGEQLVSTEERPISAVAFVYAKSGEGLSEAHRPARADTTGTGVGVDLPHQPRARAAEHRGRYRVHTNRRLRHPKELRHQVGELLGVLSEPPTVATRRATRTR